MAPVGVAALLAFVSIYREHYMDAEPSALHGDPGS